MSQVERQRKTSKQVRARAKALKQDRAWYFGKDKETSAAESE